MDMGIHTHSHKWCADQQATEQKANLFADTCLLFGFSFIHLVLFRTLKKSFNLSGLQWPHLKHEETGCSKILQSLARLYRNQNNWLNFIFNLLLWSREPKKLSDLNKNKKSHFPPQFLICDKISKIKFTI